MGLSNSGWTACTNGTCRCTGRALAAIRDNPSNLNHLPLDHAGARGQLFENLCRVTGKGCGVSPLRACDDRDQCESQDYHIHIV